MAHLYVKVDTRWEQAPLEPGCARPADSLTNEQGQAPGIKILSTRIAGQTRWIALRSGLSQFHVNGLPIPLGIKALSHRDKIDVPGVGEYFFSTESKAKVTYLPEGVKNCICPRCKTHILSGQAAVQCPKCGVWHHQMEDRKCWTYSELCATCDHVTDLDAEFEFNPEEL